MFALIGFGFFVMLALATGVLGLVVLWSAKAFGSTQRTDYVGGWILLAISAGMLYVSYEKSPFSIVLKGAAT